MQDDKVIPLSEIKLNNKETNILEAGYKYNYPERNKQAN